MGKYLKGLSLVLAISFCAFFLSNYILIGSVTITIIVGMVIGNIIKLDESYNSGILYAEKTLLGYAIGLMGINLDFRILSSLGLKTLIVIVFGMIFTIYISILIGRYFKIDTKLALLLGIGNGVCGASAISATAPILKAGKNYVGISIAIVNLLGTIGIFLLPAIVFLFGFNEIDAGILIGNTLQAVGQVTAAGFSVSDITGLSATTVKMGRVLLLTPLILFLIYIFHIKNGEKNKERVTNIPVFILVFIFLCLVSSFFVVDENIKEVVSISSHFLLVVAMAAIGLNIHFRNVKNEGKIALKIASLVFLFQIIFTLFILLI